MRFRVDVQNISSFQPQKVSILAVAATGAGVRDSGEEQNGPAYQEDDRCGGEAQEINN